MKAEEGFDLSSTLSLLTDIANPYTEITILALSDELLHFKATKPISAKTKNFRIMYSPNQAPRQLQSLAEGLKRFKVKKLIVGDQNICRGRLELGVTQLKLISLFENVAFNQIRVDRAPIDPQEILAYLFRYFKADKIVFLVSMELKFIANVIIWLHSTLLCQSIILQFQLLQLSPPEILLFAQHWVKSLPFPRNLPKPNYFGYPFPLVNKRQNFIGRREQVSLVFQGKEVVTAREMEDEGRFFVVSSVTCFKFASQLLAVLFKDGNEVSVEIGELPGEELVRLAEFVSKTFQKGYRVNAAHQLELLPCRMVLNTSGLTGQQVKRMLKIAAEPGRYEFIFYSELAYFQMMVRLFLEKPLIKFHFFLPFQNSTPQLQALLAKIDQQCEAMKRYAYQYSAILSKYSRFGFIVVSSVFQSLTSQP